MPSYLDSFDSGLGFAEIPTLTYLDGLMTWKSPTVAISNIPFSVGNIANTPAYTGGLLTPLLALLLLLIPRGGGSGGYRRRR